MLFSMEAFAAKKRCRENGKFVKCPPTAEVVAEPVVVKAPALAQAAAPSAASADPVYVHPPVGAQQGKAEVDPDKYTKAGVSASNFVTKKGKNVVRCRNLKTGRFVKCPQ
jgi:hypothetical protein